MTVFKAIDIDMDAIDKRLEAQICYTSRQKKALQKLYALFRAGEWQACLDHIHKAFKYDRKEGYHEREHIVEEVGNVLHTVAHYNVYTSEQLLAQAKNELRRRSGKRRYLLAILRSGRDTLQYFSSTASVRGLVGVRMVLWLRAPTPTQKADIAPFHKCHPSFKEWEVV